MKDDKCVLSVFWCDRFCTFTVYCDHIDFVLVLSLSLRSWLDLLLPPPLCNTLLLSFSPQCFFSFTASLYTQYLTGDAVLDWWGVFKESVVPWQQLSRVDGSLVCLSVCLSQFRRCSIGNLNVWIVDLYFEGLTHVYRLSNCKWWVESVISPQAQD